MSEIHYGFGLPIGTEGVPTPVSDGDPVSIWFNLLGQLMMYGSNLAQGTIDVSEVAPAITMIAEETFTQLIAPGSTLAVNVEDYHHGTFQYTIANIDDSVDVKIEGSLDGGDFGNMDGSDSVVQKTVNGTYLLQWSGLKIKEVLFTFDAEAGGVNATIDVLFLAGN